MRELKLARRPATSMIPVVWPVIDDKSQRAPGHVLIASDDDRLRESVNAALRQLGYTGVVALLRSVVAQPGTAARPANNPPAMLRAPRSAAERWAMKVWKGCEADGDLRTLGVWASVAGLSYSSLCETCRLVGIQPLAARDLTRVLRALVQSQANGCRIGDLLDVCDRRTLNALMRRAALDPWRRGREIPVDQFLTSQRFVAPSNAGLAMLRAMAPRVTESR